MWFLSNYVQMALRRMLRNRAPKTKNVGIVKSDQTPILSIKDLPCKSRSDLSAEVLSKIDALPIFQASMNTASSLFHDYSSDEESESNQTRILTNRDVAI